MLVDNIVFETYQKKKKNCIKKKIRRWGSLKKAYASALISRCQS